MRNKAQKTRIGALLLVSALLLSGCGGQQESAAPSPSPAPTEEAQTLPEPQGALAEAVRSLMAPYNAALNRAAQQSPEQWAYTIPGDLLSQMALDAQAAGAEVKDGRYTFTWRQSGDYTYESTAEETMNQLAEDAALTPDPQDEAPMDSQLNGDYAVSGGGLFDRVRRYDAAESLAFGTVEISDTLNGETTGYETFSFALRDGQLYFADATLDTALDTDGLPVQAGYLATVGVLRPDGLDVVEYHIDALSQLPEPAALDWSAFLPSVTPLNRITVQE